MTEDRLAIRVLSSFTATPVGPAITFWADRLGLPVELSFAPYSQVFQELQRHGRTDRPGPDAVAVLVRMEDFVPPGRHDEASAVGAELADAVAGAARRTPGTSFFIAVCPPSPAAEEDDRRREAVAQAAHELRRRVDDVANAGNVDPQDVCRQYAVSRAADHYADKLGNIPYTVEFFAALGTTVMRRLHRAMTAEPKVLVVDCDNTLWDGVLGEDGPAGLRVGLARQELQDFLLRQRRAGRLLCLCTKNDPADIDEAIATVPGMRLAPDDFVRIRADWRPKSANIRELASDLNLALDSFVFIDDSPLECAAVQSQCPEVAVVQLPQDASRALQTLFHCWPLDVGHVTEEASRRTAMYHEEQLRRHLRRQTLSLAEFIDSLDLRVTVRPAGAADRPRMADLMHRTTQFNVTGHRYGLAEIEALPTAVEQHVIEVRDRFGDYGTVGLMMASAEDGVLDVGTFLLSCRALGRGVEHRMLAHLGRRALDQGLDAVRLRYAATARNQPARQFLDEIGVPQNGIFGAGDAAKVRYDPDASPEAGPAPDRPPTGGTQRFRPWYEIASATADLTTAHSIRRAIASTLDDPGDDPGDGLDYGRIVRRIWAEILELDPGRIDGDFRSLGGGSLELVQLLARLYEELEVELPVEALLDNAVTVGGLAELVRSLQADGTPSPGDRIPWVES
ncbi:HAD-IIIC family phosphatase [Actinomycetes bacterium KLBMP 9797]